jgi:hypothetical protein
MSMAAKVQECVEISRETFHRIAIGLDSLVANIRAGMRPPGYYITEGGDEYAESKQRLLRWIQSEMSRIIEEAFKPTYGLCPHCGSPGVSRERRPGGNDACAEGHVYPSKAAVMTPVPAAVDGCVEGSPLPAAEANGKRPDPDFNRWGA